MVTHRTKSVTEFYTEDTWHIVKDFHDEKANYIIFAYGLDVDHFNNKMLTNSYRLSELETEELLKTI